MLAGVRFQSRRHGFCLRIIDHVQNLDDNLSPRTMPPGDLAKPDDHILIRHGTQRFQPAAIRLQPHFEEQQFPGHRIACLGDDRRGGSPDVAYSGVPVGTWKRHACGKGNADKQAVIAAMRSLGFEPADDNEADAIAILLWALETSGGLA